MGCSWVWHGLGIMWIFILGAFVICDGFLALRVPPL
jgi:hypothetical protein